jgi:hypothetical protein
MTGELAALLAQQQERSAILLAAYEAAPPMARRGAMLAEYRCRQRCQLLVVWQAPGPVRLARLRQYKLSPERNAVETVPAARVNRTSDGVRRWNGRVLILDELAGATGIALDLNCDHHRGHILVEALLADVEAVKPGSPIRRVFPR